MLARTIGPRFSTFPCFLQPKLNGVRALASAVPLAIQSRDEIFWKPTKLPHIFAKLQQLETVLGGHILDGELYHHGWPLGSINSAVAVKGATPTEDTPAIEYHIFDLVSENADFSWRFTALMRLFDLNKMYPLVLVPTHKVNNTHEVDSWFHHYTSFGYEGIMLRPDGPYVFGEKYTAGSKNGVTEVRSPYLWKKKQWDEDWFACVGKTQGEGKADIGIGALVCETSTGQTFNVGTGFSNAEREAFLHILPHRVLVRYLELSEDGIPINPRYMRCK